MKPLKRSLLSIHSLLIGVTWLLASVPVRAAEAHVPAVAAATHAAATNFQQSFAITGNYLNLPVDDACPKRYLILRDAKGAAVTDFRIRLAEDKPVMWGSVDVRKHRGQTLTLTFDAIPPDHPALARIHASDALPDTGKLYREEYRPQFHYTPRVGWVNDPNGLVYYNGTYHLFYQWNPYGTMWDNMHWGYATSTNLVHWTDHGAAFTPRFQREAYSGSGVVDWKNTTGLQTGGHPPILLFYTDCGARFQEKSQHKTPQGLAYSVDGGMSWQDYAKKPILEPFPVAGGKSYHVDRDPIVRWYEPGKHWTMMLFVGGGTFRVFNSTNALDWTAVSDLKVPGHNECPDMFEIAVENEPGVRKSVFVSGGGNFAVGDCAKFTVGSFDGKTFTPEQPSRVMDEGRENYSTQTFSDAPDGRRIYVAWFSRGFGTKPIGDMPANAHFRVPWELSLYKTAEGYRMRRLPVREIEILRGHKHEWSDVALTVDKPFDAQLKTAELDIVAEIQPGTTNTFSFELSGFKATYDAASGKMSALGRTVDVKPVDGLLRFRILRDRLMVEMFINDGTIAMTGLHTFDASKPALRITADGDGHRVKRLTAYPMKSMWEAVKP
jgi:sucrose-6-phosphate hydrolase SacC (GH32 family)